jgi:hypothetical protein
VVSRTGLANLVGGGLRHGTSELDEPGHREAGQPLAQRRPVRPGSRSAPGVTTRTARPASQPDVLTAAPERGWRSPHYQRLDLVADLEGLEVPDHRSGRISGQSLPKSILFFSSVLAARTSCGGKYFGDQPDRSI